MKKDIDKRILKVGASLIFLTFVLFNFSVLKSALSSIIGLLTPFLVGGIIAIFINVPLEAIENLLRVNIFKNPKFKGIVRPIALVLTLLIIFGFSYFVFDSVIPELAKTLMKFFENLPTVMDRIVTWLENFSDSDLEIINNIEKEIYKLSENFSTVVEKSIKSILVGGLNVVTNTFSFLLTTLLGFVFAIYLLFYKEQLGIQIYRALHAFMSEDTADVLTIIGQRIGKVFSDFLGGTFMEAIIFGIMNFTGMMILGLPYKTTLSVLAFFMTFIPYFGAFFGTFIGSILIAAEDLRMGAVFAIMATALQQIEGNIIYPKVVGSQVGLPGIWVMVSVTIGASSLGLLGMLLAVPTATLIYYTLGDIVEYKTLKKNNNIENEPVLLSKVMKKNFLNQVNKQE